MTTPVTPALMATRRMALPLLPRSLPLWLYTPYVNPYVEYTCLWGYQWLTNCFSRNRHSSSSVLSRPTFISELAGVVPYRWAKACRLNLNLQFFDESFCFFFFSFLLLGLSDSLLCVEISARFGWCTRSHKLRWLRKSPVCPYIQDNFQRLRTVHGNG